MQEAKLHDLSDDVDSAMSQQEETLLEFRAGKMLLEGKRVVPDTRKGLIRIARESKAVDDSQLCIAVNNFINQPLVIIWITRVQNEFTCIAR
ncbi:hypothetical protein V6N11_032904 [Hibiscus sabdariffa]|uniref:Pru domain-containing protein n=1 Tax=Hibiscus sabdariffa TaxID=183260 RepID=A0ABR2T205_9ROSI